MARQRWRETCRALGAAFVPVWMAALAAAGQVQDISKDWGPSGLRRVAVAGVKASSFLSSENGQYAPARAADGNRGSKWVANVPPSDAAPQWITLNLFGSQKVSAVAVFGERIDNDGILDAKVQVAGSEANEFTKVATIQDAGSGGWLATFDPVQTTAVRLVITRSGGPSPHTDVYEVEIFGPPLSTAELKGYAAARLDDCAVRWKELHGIAEGLGLKTEPRFAGFQFAFDSIDATHRRLSERFAQWDSLGESDQPPLVGEIERLEASLQRMIHGLGKAATVWPDRAKDIAAARRFAQQCEASGKAASSREEGRLRLANNRVCVVLDESDGTWDATWLDFDAAVRHIGFGAEVDGRNIAPKEVQAEVVPFTDTIGNGMEIRQYWGEDIEIERFMKLYDGQPAVVVWAQITNRTDRDVPVGVVKMIDLPEGDRGWWHLACLMQAPASPCRPAPLDEAGVEAAVQYGSADVLALIPQRQPGGLAIGSLSAREGSPSAHARFQAGEGGTSLGVTLHVGRVLHAGETLAVDPAWLSVEQNGFDALERYGDAVAATASPPVRTGANALWCSWYPIRMGIDEEIVLTHAAIAAEHFKPLGMSVIQLDHGWQRGDVCGDWVPNERFPHGLKWLSEQLQSRWGMKLGLWIAPTQVAFTSQLFRDHPEWMIKNAEGKPAGTGRWFWVPNPEMTVIDASHPAAEQWIAETFARLSSEGAGYYKIDFIAGSPALGRAMAAIRRGAGPDSWIRYCQTPPLLSVGLASSAYQGPDTGDAGLQNWMELERANAPLLASNYWVNDRLYHREVCDMSVGMKADVEEARFKMSLMAMAGCSISFSDDFRPLDLSRIHMMQKCLPPGNPTARPLDLFQRAMPSLWHTHCKSEVGEWDAVGVLNFEDHPQEQTIELAALGLPEGTEVTVFEFWEEKFLGSYKDRVTVSLAPHTARVLLIHRRPTRPQVIATDMHLLGGYHEIKRLMWDEPSRTLAGCCRRMPGVSGRVYVYVPDGYRLRGGTAQADSSIELTHVGGPLWMKQIVFDKADAEFSTSFDLPGIAEPPHPGSSQPSR